MDILDQNFRLAAGLQGTEIENPDFLYCLRYLRLVNGWLVVLSFGGDGLLESVR